MKAISNEKFAAGEQFTVKELYLAACAQDPAVRAHSAQQWQAYYNQQAQSNAAEQRKREAAAGGISGGGAGQTKIDSWDKAMEEAYAESPEMAAYHS